MKRTTILPDEELTGKLQQALTASSEELFQCIQDQHPEVLAAILKNRNLNEDHLLALLKRSDLHEDLPDKIYRRHRQSMSHKLLVGLVKNRATPDTIIRILIPQLHLFELVDLCLMSGASADLRLATERNILQRLPTTPLGNKLTLARRATATIATALLKDGNPTLLEICLNNPHLKEAAIYQFLSGPHSTAETISMIARHTRWRQRPNLRRAILKNTRTPDIWFTLWLPKLALPLLKQLLSGRGLNPRQKRLVTDELKRRG